MKRGLILTLSLIALLSCGKEPLIDSREESTPTIKQTGREQVTSVVMFSEDMLSVISDDLAEGKIITKSMALNDFVDYYGVVSIERVFHEDARYTERHHKYGLHKWYRIVYDKSASYQTKAADIRRALSSVPGIELVEEDIKIQSYSMVPDDPYYSNQWGLKQNNGVDINVESVWHQGIVGDPRVVVVVTDTGIDLEHEDLKDNCIPARKGGSYNLADLNYNIVPSSHGTHVAGIIAGMRNNGTGVAGIAGGDAQAGKPGARILSAVMFGESESQNTTAGADGIVYGADNGALISQNSWGPKYDTNDDGVIDAEELEYAKNISIPSYLKSAVDYFIEYAGCDADGNQKIDSPMKGGVVIFAAGNDNLAFGTYAQYPPVISVAAISQDGSKASFSNYGSWVDICAPGTRILSSIEGNAYAYLDGTSMACPMVSGVAALVVEARGGMGFTSEMLSECLIKGADPTKVHNFQQTGPLVDAFGAVNYGRSEVPEPIRQFEVSAKANSITVKWQVENGGNDMPAYGAAVFASRDPEQIRNLNPRSPARGVIAKSLITITMNVGDTASLRVDKLDFEEDYYLAVIPYNYGSVYAESYETLVCRTLPNNPPLIEADIAVDDIIIKASESRQVKFFISEPDGHSFTSSWESASDAETWTGRGYSEVWLSLSGPNAAAGKYTAKLMAKDSYGLENELLINYTIRENTPVTVASTIPSALFSLDDKAGREIGLGDMFYDADEDFLSYEISNSSSKVCHVVENNGVLYITPGGVGRSEITVTAKDPSGTSASQSFVVLVKENVDEISVFPTQVETLLYVGAGESESSIRLRIVSQGGVVVYEGTVSGSVFTPASIDLSKLAPGVYAVDAETQGQKAVKSIVKL